MAAKASASWLRVQHPELKIPKKFIKKMNTSNLRTVSCQETQLNGGKKRKNINFRISNLRILKSSTFEEPLKN